MHSSLPPPSRHALSKAPSMTANSSAVMSSIIATMASFAQTATEIEIPTTSSPLPSELLSSSSSSPLSNITEEERRRYLDILQEETTPGMVPTVVFLSIIATVGLFGNSMVLLVYSRKSRQNATDVYFVCVAIFDLLTNTLTIPGEIYQALNQWNYYNVALCRFLEFCTVYTTMTSVLTVLAIAVYRKICTYFESQTSTRTATIVCVVIALGSCLLTTPYVIMRDIRTIPTPRHGVYGQRCSLDDAYSNSIWPTVYTSCFFLLLIGGLASIFVHYVLISRQAWRHSKTHAALSSQSIPTTSHGNGDSRKSRQGKAKAGFLGNVFKYDVDKSGDSRNEGSRLRGEAVELKSVLITQEKDEDGKAMIEVDGDYSSLPTENKCDINLFITSESNTNQASRIVDNAISKHGENVGDPGRRDVSNEAVNEKDNDPDTTLQYGNGTERDDVSTDGKGSPQKVSMSRNPSPERSLHRNSPDTRTRREKVAFETSDDSDDSDNDSLSHATATSTGHSVEVEDNGNQKKETMGRSKRGLATSKMKSNRPRGKVLTKATVMSIAISATLIMAFLPYLVITSSQLFGEHFFSDITPVGIYMLHLFVRFYFINSAVNAIIYGICDVRFREQCWEFIRCRK